MLIRVSTFRMHFRLRFIHDKRQQQQRIKTKIHKNKYKLKNCFVHIHEIRAFIYLWFAAHLRNHYHDFDEARMSEITQNILGGWLDNGHANLNIWANADQNVMCADFTNWTRSRKKKHCSSCRREVGSSQQDSCKYFTAFSRHSNTKIVTSMRYKMRFTAMKIAYKSANKFFCQFHLFCSGNNNKIIM